MSGGSGAGSASWQRSDSIVRPLTCSLAPSRLQSTGVGTNALNNSHFASKTSIFINGDSAWVGNYRSSNSIIYLLKKMFPNK